MTAVSSRTRGTGSLRRSTWLLVFALAGAVFIAGGIGQVQAAQVTLAWDANTEPELAGYKLHYGTTPGTYGTTVDVGNVLTYTVTGLTDGATYYFAATAFDNVGNESGFSNEVRFGPEFDLAGNGIAIADGDTTPSATDGTDFGSVSLGAAPVTRTFTIQNSGSATLTLSGSPLIVVGGTNAADFTVTAQPSASIAAASSTTFTVSFTSAAAGTRSATISIASNDADENPYNFSIQGTGNGTPEINLVGNTASIADGDTTPDTADHTDFGSVDVAAGTVTRTFTVQNSGSGALTLSGSPVVVVGGTNAADFTVTVQPAASIAAGGSTTFQVRFDPSAAGARVATINIGNNDANENPYNFSIQGAGTAAPEMNVAFTNVSIVDGDSTPSTADGTDFGSISVGAAPVTRTFTIQNSGSGALTLSGSPLVVVGGTNAADFTVTAQPAASIAAGGNTSFTVNFAPGAAGTRSATISIANSDADENPYNFSVQGTGVEPAAPDIVLLGGDAPISDGSTTPTTTNLTDFEKTKLEGGTVTRTFTIKNNGPATLNLTGSPLVAIGGTNPSDFVVSVNPVASIAAGTSTTFVVTFDPSGSGDRYADIHIANNDTRKNTYDFTIKGKGVAPPNPPKNIRANK